MDSSTNNLMDTTDEIARIRRYGLICALLWSMLLSGLFMLYAFDHRQVVIEIGRSMAVASFEKDLLFRRWAARHGGVYVPQTPATPPNPYLSGIPERDIVTPSGRPLTMINPAYMTRQIFELAQEQPDKIQGHITSLNPIRPENAPDAWERQALTRFEQGLPEVVEQIQQNGKPYLRFMRHLIAEKPCLSCHAAQGYKEGEKRGGISVTLPLTPVVQAMGSQIRRVAFIHVFVWLVGIAMIWFGSRKISGTMTLLRDERNSLKESEERFHTLHNASFGGILIHDNGCIKDCNQGLSDMTGYTIEEMIDMDGLRLIAPESLELVRKNMLSGFEKRYEVTGIRKDGTRYPLAVNGKNIPYRGHAARVIEFRDITERRRAEEALNSSKQQLSTLIETIPASIFMKDGYGRWQIVNKIGIELFRLTGLAWQGKNEKDLILLQPAMRDVFETCYETDEQAWQEGSPLHFEERVPTLDGEYRDFEVIKVPLFEEDGQRKCLVVVSRDITERRQAEETRQQLEQQFHQAQKLESLGVLAGGVAHDFNNILTLILGQCYLARESFATQEAYQASFRQIETAASRAAELCRQMLTYAGKSPLVQTRINLWMLVDEVVRMLQAATNKNVTINLDLRQRIPHIKGDIGQIQQIVMNLIINATEAIGDQNGVITVVLSNQTVVPGSEEIDTFGTVFTVGRYVCLEVSDTGSGMDEETRNRIFEPFFTTKFTGRGLGMSAIRGIIASHEGMLQLTSFPGVGTTFRIFFPVPDSSGPADVDTPELTPLEEAGGTIMLVDDEEMLRNMGESLLEALGFSPVTAQNGREALEIYRNRGSEIDLILLDLIMPEMGGIEAYHELRAISRNLPIIICSGYGVESVSDVIENDPHAGFVHKPYKPAELRDVVRRMIGMNRA